MGKYFLNYKTCLFRISGRGRIKGISVNQIIEGEVQKFSLKIKHSNDLLFVFFNSLFYSAKNSVRFVLLLSF